MRKILLLILILLSSTTLRAMMIENKDIVSDSVEIKKKNFFIEAFNFIAGDYDTLYVSPNKYDFTVQTIYYNNNQFYSMRSTNPHDQNLRFSPRPGNKIGFYFGWKFFFVGWSFDVNDMFNKQKGKSNGTSFELSLYSAAFGLDLMYQKTGNNYKIHKAKGFGDAFPTNYSINFDGFDVDLKSLNLYYILNNKHFSYPAAYSMTTQQRRSCGSFIFGFSVSTHNLNFDYNKLPIQILNNMNSDMKVHHIKYTNISLSAGYTFNWVFAKNFLANISLSPVLAYKVSKVSSREDNDNQFFKKINIDLLLRAGVVYNNGKYYVGSSFLGRNYGYRQKNFSLNNGYGTLQVYAGFNFVLNKKYRANKKKNTMSINEYQIDRFIIQQ